MKAPRFAGFAYFDGDATYCVDASFERSKDEKQFAMAAFNGKTIPFRKYGVFRFQQQAADSSSGRREGLCRRRSLIQRAVPNPDALDQRIEPRIVV